MEIPAEAREQINAYIQSTFTDVPAIVTQFEQRARALPIPPHHIQPELGKLLQVLVKMKQARAILEVGTMWGYSAWWMYQGLAETGTLITLEKELKHYTLAKAFFATLEMDRAEVRHTDALQELTQFSPQQFDFVFLDADKREYPRFLELIIPLLQPGGVLVVDNVIFSSSWKGKTVADDTDDERIQNARRLNTMLAEHPDFVAVPVAINSGIMVAVKR